jgi:hypothetical protein
MPTGALDANGVWLYGEDDARDTFSALLNIGQDSVSDAIGSDRGRLDALEALTSTGASTTGIATAATGWSATAVLGRKRSGIIVAQFNMTRTGAAITVPAGGDIADSIMATLNAGWQRAGGPVPGLHSAIGPVCSGYISAANELILTNAAPGTTIATGTLIALTATYIAA